MYGGLDFNSMMEYAANLWCERLHTIDVESQDTAKVNRFYTALYRSSFLPHELSDVGELQYGDFAMWDTYRAQLPLYHLLTPMLSGEMMQSLVRCIRMASGCLSFQLPTVGRRRCWAMMPVSRLPMPMSKASATLMP